ncbi:IS110 family transposase, partial [Mesorhizobium sp. M0514]
MDSDLRCGKVRLLKHKHPTFGDKHARCSSPTESADRYPHHLGAIFISLDLSRSKWLITSLSPGGGEKMSKHMVA